jgi:hypothetical protein
MKLLEAFEASYNALGRTPNGAAVSADLWRELQKAGRIIEVQAQINYRGLVSPIDTAFVNVVVVSPQTNSRDATVSAGGIVAALEREACSYMPP